MQRFAANVHSLCRTFSLGLDIYDILSCIILTLFFCSLWFRERSLCSEIPPLTNFSKPSDLSNGLTSKRLPEPSLVIFPPLNGSWARGKGFIPSPLFGTFLTQCQHAGLTTRIPAYAHSSFLFTGTHATISDSQHE
jgi:hypothetical protein